MHSLYCLIYFRFEMKAFDDFYFLLFKFCRSRHLWLILHLSGLDLISSPIALLLIWQNSNHFFLNFTSQSHKAKTRLIIIARQRNRLKGLRHFLALFLMHLISSLKNWQKDKWHEIFFYDRFVLILNLELRSGSLHKQKAPTIYY